MKANYFRYMFQNTKRGVIHTASSKGISGDFCLYYLCSDGRRMRAEETEEKRFLPKGEVISALILENLHPADLKTAAYLLNHNTVRRVFLPYKDSAAELEELSLAEEVQILEEKQEVTFCENGWDVWIKCLEQNERGTLVVKHGPSEQMKKNADCLMTVKPMEKNLNCQTCVNPENNACAMRCCLYNDFTTCKGHNDKRADDYVTGAMLLGNVDLANNKEELDRILKKEGSDIRMMALPGGNQKLEDTENFLDAFASFQGQLNKYYFISENLKENEKILKAILKKGPRHIPVLTSDEYGLCISGIFPQI
jgi:hypothetical protein